MPTCPNGHQSGSDDWCEVCGHRMGGAAVPPPSAPPGYGYPPPAPAPAPELCPQCRTPREANAPYCEECRWNFLTNTATSYTPLAPRTTPGQGPGVTLPPGFQTPPPGQAPPPGPPPQGGPHEPPYGTRPPGPPYEPSGTRPSQINRPAEPLLSEPAPGPGPSAGRPGGPDDGWGAPPPRPPRFERVSPPQAPGRADDDWPPAQAPGRPADDDWPLRQAPGRPDGDWPPAPPSFDGGAPRPPAPPAADNDWTLPPPSLDRPFPPPPGMEHPEPGQDGREGSVPQQPGYGAPARWAVVIGPDREYFMAMMHRSGPEAAGLNLPAYSPEQHMPLTGNQITIGRRRHSTGESPDIDLAVPPEDPGVSHQHAMLVQQPDGGWAVVDQNSTNGTTLNGGEEPIQPYVPVPLNEGDRVHVGAWTTIRIVRD
ncbi:FHA domain-containing protein [Streptomyces tremellae]|uniref:FHA domain-containing protein n=1 Tax=Streptomyces tremellae TaxID=1124239 RepID=A0ABP7FXY3_9ACTN